MLLICYRLVLAGWLAGWLAGLLAGLLAAWANFFLERNRKFLRNCLMGDWVSDPKRIREFPGVSDQGSVREFTDSHKNRH